MAVINGTEGNNTIDASHPGTDPFGNPAFPSDAADQIFGFGGTDIIDGRGGNDAIDGGAGADLVTGGGGADHLIGGSERDTIFGNEDNDEIEGGTGNDLLSGEENNDTIDGGDGDDELHGGSDADTLTGGAGLDNVLGEGGNDTLVIDAASEVMAGEAYNGGTHVITGDPLTSGDLLTIRTSDLVDLSNVDILDIERIISLGPLFAKAEQITGKLVLSSDSMLFTTAGTVDLSGRLVGTPIFFLNNNAGNRLHLTGDFGNYTVHGGAADDFVDGGERKDIIDGAGGEDLLKGNGGDDELTGGGANDYLIGGAGLNSAHFSGVREAYLVTDEGIGDFQVTHIGGGATEGVDILENIQILTFADCSADPAWAAKAGGKNLAPALVPQIGSALGLGAPGAGAFGASNFAYAGAFSAAQIVTDGFDFGSGGGFPLAIGESVLMTTGKAATPLTNTGLSYSVNLNGAGDADLTAAAAAAGRPASFDASVITFDLTVSDAATKFISFDVIMMSEEFSNSDDFGDLAAVFANGTNHALFNGDPTRTLTINQDFAPAINNQPTPGVLPIEYNGVSKLLNVVVPVHLGVHTVKIGIADLGDGTIDSALFIGNARGFSSGASGMYLQVNGTGGGDNLTGGALPEQFFLGLGADSVDAGDGDDLLRGEDGEDTLEGGLGDDTVDGGDDNDTLIGGSGAGNDTYIGGAGVDAVVFASATQAVTVNLSAASNHAVGAQTGTDQIASVENVTGGAGADQITGNAAANRLEGGGGDDRLNGLGGIDTMIGAAGNDWFFVDSGGDVVSELAGNGSDRVSTSLSYALAVGASIETFTTTNNAGAAAINLTGNALAQTIVGNAGANMINGAGGNDLMQGLAGNDWYYVDAAGDRAVEAAGGGADRVLAAASFALEAGSEIELLKTTNDAGAGTINLTGNAFANYLLGNAGASTLDGKAGNDIMQGLGGNDIYMVDAAGDRAVEAAAKGSDRVLASVSFMLEANSEIELLKTANDAGTGAVNLTGNNLANHLLGNAGANTLDGKAGVDILQGLGGNDFYFVDSAADRAVEAAGKGADRVFASVSYTLEAGSEIETLTPTAFGGTSALNLTGNAIVNTVYGNAGANILNGGLGNDTLVGLGGADSFLFNTALNATTNVDRLADFNVAADTIRLENAIFSTLAAGALAAGAFRTGTAALDADDRIIHNSSAGTLRYDADGNGAGAAVLFATLGAGLALTNADFFVV